MSRSSDDSVVEEKDVALDVQDAGGSDSDAEFLHARAVPLLRGRAAEPAREDTPENLSRQLLVRVAGDAAIREEYNRLRGAGQQQQALRYLITVVPALSPDELHRSLIPFEAYDAFALLQSTVMDGARPINQHLFPIDEHCISGNDRMWRLLQGLEQRLLREQKQSATMQTGRFEAEEKEQKNRWCNNFRSEPLSYLGGCGNVVLMLGCMGALIYFAYNAATYAATPIDQEGTQSEINTRTSVDMEEISNFVHTDLIGIIAIISSLITLSGLLAANQYDKRYNRIPAQQQEAERDTMIQTLSRRDAVARAIRYWQPCHRLGQCLQPSLMAASSGDSKSGQGRSRPSMALAGFGPSMAAEAAMTVRGRGSLNNPRGGQMVTLLAGQSGNNSDDDFSDSGSSRDGHSPA